MDRLFNRASACLAAALAFALPASAVDYTGTDYEPWSYSAGCVVWRGAGDKNFEVNSVADVAADGTVGATYEMAWNNAAATTSHRFCAGQNEYVEPGFTLVYDAAGYQAAANATFTPLSFGGLKIDALADEAEGTPYSITGSGTRYTDFGRTDVATYFEFNKSFTVNRSSATRCYGAVTIQVAQGATFKSQAALWAEVGGTVKLTGEGAVELPNGLFVNNDSTSTLDLSAATRPAITGNVTVYEGGAIVLPAATAPSAETPFSVCSGTLIVGTYNMVKIGDADPIPATLTVSGGAITGIEPYSLERTFTSDYPTVVPRGAVFTFQGGTAEEPVVLDARIVNGTLKTEGYFSFTSYAASASSTLEVVSGKVTLDPGNNWFRGTLTIDAGAEFVNVSTDAVQYGGTFTANVHGTLNMGSTRWSLGSNNTLNFYEGCTVTGSGDGNNGTFDWIENATGTLNVDGDVSLAAPIRIRAGAKVNFNVDTTDQKGLTLAGTIGSGAIVKKGAGLVKFTTNPPYAITVENGAFTFAVDATPTITYSAKPGAGTTMSMWYATQATWKGTVVIGALSAPGALPLNTYGNANSKIVLAGTTGNCYLNGTTTVASELVVGTNANNVVEFNNGNSGQVVTFSKVSGPGKLKLVGWTGCSSATYNFTTLDNFTGLAVHNAITRGGGGTFTIGIGDIVTSNSTASGACVLPIANTALDNATGTVVFNLDNAQLNGASAYFEERDDGIYVIEPVAFVDFGSGVTNYYTTVSNAVVAASAANKIVDLMATPDASDTYRLAVGETVRIRKNGFTYDGVVFREGAEFSNTTTEAAGVTIYRCQLYTAYITYADSSVEWSTLALEQLLPSLWMNYAPAKAGLVVTVVDGSDATFTPSDLVSAMYVYNASAHTYTLKPMIAAVSFKQGGTELTQYVTSLDQIAQLALQYDITAKLLEDLDISQSGSIVVPGSVDVGGQTVDAHPITLDLGGKTITGPADGYVLVNAGNTVTIIGSGTVTGAGIVTNATADAVTVISNGTYNATGDLFAAEEGSDLTVYGGTFNQAVDDAYLAEGYEVKDNGNGTYGVREDKGWIYETAEYKGYTGSWSGEIEYDATTGKARIENGNTYTASAPSASRMVTLDMTFGFDAINEEDDDIADAKAAIRLGAGANEGEFVFQLYTSDNNGSKWVDVSADGITATTNVDFNFVFVLDMTNRTYTATVGGVALTSGSSSQFAFAGASATDAVQSVEFTGAGSFTSLIGSYNDDAPTGFAEGQTIGSVTLTGAQADWLNAQKNYDVLAAKLASMTQTALDTAYLLNLDVLSESSYAFTVTKIEFGTDGQNETVVVTVTLTRSGALDGGINGTLKLKGGTELGTAFDVLDQVTIVDADFSDGDSTTCTFQKGDAPAKFYQAVIE